MNRWWLPAIAGTVTMLGAGPVWAQGARDSLRVGVERYDDLWPNAAPAIPLLQYGLDPEAGPMDALWTAGLQRLVRHLIGHTGSEELGRTWIRWAWRLAPDLSLADLPPSLAGVFRAESTEVARDGAGQSRTQTAWEWSLPVDADARGSLRIVSRVSGSEMRAAVRDSDGDVVYLVSGETASLSSGTYTVLASAEAFEGAAVRREVLPGVVTVLRFNLVSTRPAFLYIASDPWALVLVDEEIVGYTALAARPMQPGIHAIRLERDCHMPFDTTVTVASDERIRLGTIRLRPVESCQ